MVHLAMMTPFGEGLNTSGDALREVVAIAEQAGVESLWTVEHVVVADKYEPLYPYSTDGQMPGPAQVPMPDPLETIAFMAGASRTLRFGTAMIVAPLHSPVVLAKRAATIDRHSGGRLMLGLGIGWQKEEYAAVDVPYQDRGRRLDECIGAMRALWSNEPASFHGKHVAFDDIYCLPRPKRGTIPIVLGGNSAPAVSRAGRIGDGWFPYTIAAEDFAAAAGRLRATALEAGRNPADIEITAWPGSCDPARELDVDWVRRYVEAGANRLVFSPRIDKLYGARGVAALADQIHDYRERVLDRL